MSGIFSSRGISRRDEAYVCEQRATSRNVFRWLSLGFLLCGGVPLVALSLGLLAFPRRGGYVAFAQVIAPYLFLPFLAVAPLALIRGHRAFRIALALTLAFALLRYPPAVHPALLASATTADITVMTWNVFPRSVEDQRASLRPVLATRPAGVVALQEAHGEWLRDDPEIVQAYPHQLTHAAPGWTGIVLLSAYRLHESGVLEAPFAWGEFSQVLWMRLDLGEGRMLTVATAHPISPQGGVRYDTVGREAMLPYIRQIVDAALARGEPLILMGDFNVTDREPMYRDLASGLRDAHREAGNGWGHTWGPSGSSPPLFRIDYVFSGPKVTPIRLSTDCIPRGSDHCIVRGEFALP